MAKSDKPQTHRRLFENIKTIIYEARNAVTRNINTAMVMTYFEIGRMIVEHEQGGAERAEYAKESLKLLSQKLTGEFGRGFSVDNLELMRRFYLVYSKSETLSRISPKIFQLSWSHYVFLMRLSEAERKFYEIEAVKQNWSLIFPRYCGHTEGLGRIHNLGGVKWKKRRGTGSIVGNSRRKRYV